MRKLFITLTSLLVFGCSSESKDQALPASYQDLGTSHQAIINPVVDTSVSQALTGVAAIYVADHPDYEGQVYCSGTLITSRHILTAAHCVADLTGRFALIPEDDNSPDCQWTAKFVSSGTNKFFNYIKVGFGYTPYQVKTHLYDVKSVTYHSGYAHVANANTCESSGYSGYEYTENDIAILELTDDIPQEVANPIPILPPWLSITQKNIDDGDEVVVAGYGYDQTGYKGYLDWTYMKLTSYCDNPANNHYCTYDEVLKINGCPPTQINCDSNNELNYTETRLAYPKSSYFYLYKNAGPCNGDSGGPTLLLTGHRIYVAGITSYGDKICKAYGVSTAVQDYYDWIVKIAPEAKDYLTEDCHNFLDDDNDGFIDHEDPECAEEYYCGDGIVQDNELCDGNAFFKGFDQCSEWNLKYESGKVTCTSDCQINEDNCVEYSKPNTCGNGIVDSDEQCDGDVFQTPYDEPMETNLCNEYSIYFKSGTLKCSPSCRIETDDCVFYKGPNTCGDNILDPGEVCDGDQFKDTISTNCHEFDPYFSGGTIKCSVCTLNFSDCSISEFCGDGMVSGEEPCDGNLFVIDENRCKEWSNIFKLGNVTCNSNCSINYDACKLNDDFKNLCGNGIIDSKNIPNTTAKIEEECDGDILPKGDKCSAWDSRYIAGKVFCSDNCTVNYENCILESEHINDENHSLFLVLAKEAKPDIIVAAKTSDSVTFFKGNNIQKEELLFYKNSAPPHPDDPQNPSTPSNPEEPTNPETPSNKSKDSGCSSAPTSPSSPFSWPLLLIIAATWGYRKRFIRFHPPKR